MKGKLDIEVRESITALKKMLKGEKNSFRASRLIALILYKTGECASSLEIAKSIGYTAEAVEDWFEKYREAGLEAYLMANLWGKIQFNDFRPRYMCAN
ncbi:MAG: hypothetical protein D6730_10475 [Bacteroidetes bacterium]|nr:MAG: hypothetical protein D6730_10475 [Bacteroidota bacterium]